MANSTTQPVISYTAGQQEAHTLVRSYLMGKLKLNWVWITGPAGTGKTLITTDIARGMAQRMKICISAPTGKAINVLKAKLGDAPISGFRTVHSLLGLRDNENEFEPDFIKAADVAIKYYDAIFFDESSMLNNDMFSSLIEHQGKCKFVFIGDVEQLLPPKGQQANVFYESDDIKGVRLTEIVRQGKLSPIIQLASHLLTDFSVPDKFVLNLHEGHGTYLADSAISDERTWFRECLLDIFSSREYRDNTNFARVICATVNMTSKMNDTLRSYIYGDSVHESKILYGENLIANGRHVVDDNVVLGNNDQIKILSYTVENYDLTDQIRFKVYNAHALLIDQETEVDIRILHEDSQADYDMLLTYFKSMQTQHRKGTPAYSAAAANYKRLLSTFAQVGYNYATTCHKAQGSTYNKSIVLLNNLLQVSDANWGYDEKRRWLYTAVTRASQDVIMVV